MPLLSNSDCDTRAKKRLHAAQMQTEQNWPFASLQRAARLFEKIGNKCSKANCFDNLTTLYRRQEQCVSALAVFNQAIVFFPDDAVSYQNRAAL